MVSAHFTTIPWKPYTAHEVLYCPFANDIVETRFEELKTFLLVSFAKNYG